MKYEPTQILGHFEPGIRSAIMQTFQTWQNYHQGRISELESILNSFKILLVNTEEWSEQPDLFWKEFESEFVKIRLWSDSLIYVSPENLEDKITGTLSVQFKQLLNEYPAELRILIGETYWQIEAGDSIAKRLRKKWQPIKNVLKDYAIDSINKYRHFRDKPPIKSRAEERVIILNSLLVYYLKYPVIKFLIDEWQRYMQAVTGQLFVLHMNIKEFANKSLILDELQKILDPAKKNEIFENLFELAEVLKNTDETLQALARYDKQFIDRFEKQWKIIFEEFLKAWNWAGTFLLKNRSYSGEKLNQAEYSISSRFRKYLLSWQVHFQALQGEWQKDTEISLLRYRTVKNLYYTSTRLHQGTQNEIESSLIIVKDLLSKTSQEIIDSKDNTSLRAVISTNRKSTLNALQELLETIHGVNMMRLLDEYILQLETAVESLGEEHYVFVRQDTERRPPKPVTDRIPLRELVWKEIFKPVRDNFQHFAQQIEVKVKHILRVISEIDQMIEFNTDSTLKLISKSGDLPILDRAKNEMSEGLDRSARRIHELRLSIGQIPEKSSEELLNFSLSFEKNLGKFLEGEKLFKFKRHLKRKRFRNRLHQNIKNQFNIVKSFFPKLMRKSLSTLKSLWTHYFSFTPVKHSEFELNSQKLNRYLSETESRIKNLPFIYQKLFHFRALYDERFFSNRESEIARLESELNKWSTGSASTVAVIGEKGCGISSFLNYAQNRLFKKIPTIRISVTKSLYHSEKIMNLVSEAFDFENVQDWDELTNNIKAHHEKRVCLIENIQLLFLKTAQGFTGLEKLLELISQTTDHIFWVVTSTIYSWQFLEKAIGIQQYFQHSISLQRMSAEELRDVILKRHRASGYHLEFEPVNSAGGRMIFKDNKQKSSYTLNEKEYFEKLHAYAGGNISTALLIWLRSIREFSKERMVLSSDFDIEFSFLEKIPENYLITLGTILHHGVLTNENYSLVLRQNNSSNQLKLEQLCQQGFLNKNGTGFQIHPFIYRPLVQILKKKHILT